MNDYEKLLSMQKGDTLHFNWFEDGGAEVFRSFSGWNLYYVPQYGGEPKLIGVYTEENLDELIEEINAWT